MSEENSEKLRDERNRLLRDAEKAAYAYFVELEIGVERERAFYVFENIRTALCVP